MLLFIFVDKLKVLERDDWPQTWKNVRRLGIDHATFFGPASGLLLASVMLFLCSTPLLCTIYCGCKNVVSQETCYELFPSKRPPWWNPIDWTHPYAVTDMHSPGELHVGHGSKDQRVRDQVFGTIGERLDFDETVGESSESDAYTYNNDTYYDDTHYDNTHYDNTYYDNRAYYDGTRV